MIKTRPMRTHKFSRREMIARLFAQLAPGLGGAIIAQVRNHLILTIDQSHARAQIGDHEFAAPLAEVTW